MKETNKTVPIIWVLADDRSGNVNQALGVANALNLKYEIKNITYNKLATFPNFVRGASTVGISKKSRQSLCEPYPDIIIAAGRRTAPLARWIKNKSNDKTKLVQIMYPGDFGASDFSLIAVPKHDIRAPKKSNIIRIDGAPHIITKEKIDEETPKWKEKFLHLKKPHIAIIVGGATKSKSFSEQMAKDLIEKAIELGGDEASFLVTTSRRTGKKALKTISKILPSEKTFLYKWGDKGENPYLAYLAYAEKIIVTGDSVSMCSESCATGKPVYIYAPEQMISKKHSRLVQSLCEENYACLLDGKINKNYENKERKTLNSAYQIAKYIKENII